MTVLALVPTIRELDALVAAFDHMGLIGEPVKLGRLEAISYLSGRAVVVEGGANNVVAPELSDSAYAPAAPEYPLATIVYVPVSANGRSM